MQDGKIRKQADELTEDQVNVARGGASSVFGGRSATQTRETVPSQYAGDPVYDLPDDFSP